MIHEECRLLGCEAGRVALLRTDISEEPAEFIFMVEKISKLKMLAVTSNPNLQ
jgi:hypothetical protein